MRSIFRELLYEIKQLFSSVYRTGCPKFNGLGEFHVFPQIEKN